MRNTDDFKSIWPNESRILLLKAATMQYAQALDYWRSFLKTEPDLMDLTHQQLLPSVYYNLVIRQRVEDVEWHDVLKRHYLTCYANNRYLLRSVILPLHELCKKNIPVIALKGLAHTLSLYRDQGARIMTDLDILVPETHFSQAAAVLEAHGWKTFKCRPLKNYNSRLVHALSFFDKEGHCVDLHCHVLSIDCYPESNDVYWEQAVPFLFHDEIVIKTLCVTDHLLHTLIHGLTRTYATPSLRWVVDAVLIMHYNPIDWQRLLFLAQTKRLSVCLEQALSYLVIHFSVSIPEDFLPQLRAIPADHIERRMFELMHTKNTLLKKQQYVFYSIQRNNPDKARWQCFIVYLKYIAITDSLIKVPFRLPGKMISKLRREWRYIRNR
jgi:hypothetical protein